MGPRVGSGSLEESQLAEGNGPHLKKIIERVYCTSNDLPIETEIVCGSGLALSATPARNGPFCAAAKPLLFVPWLFRG